MNPLTTGCSNEAITEFDMEIPFTGLCDICMKESGRNSFFFNEPSESYYDEEEYESDNRWQQGYY